MNIEMSPFREEEYIYVLIKISSIGYVIGKDFKISILWLFILMHHFGREVLETQPETSESGAWRQLAPLVRWLSGGSNNAKIPSSRKISRVFLGEEFQPQILHLIDYLKSNKSEFIECSAIYYG